MALDLVQKYKELLSSPVGKLLSSPQNAGLQIGKQIAKAVTPKLSALVAPAESLQGQQRQQFFQQNIQKPVTEAAKNFQIPFENISPIVKVANKTIVKPAANFFAERAVGTPGKVSTKEDIAQAFKDSISDVAFGGITTVGNKSISAADDVIKAGRSEISDGIKASKASLKDGWKSFYTNWVNKFQPVEDLVSGVEKRTGAIPSEINPKYLISRLQGAGGVAELRHKQSLEPIINQLGDVSKADFDVFLKSKRDIELAQRGIKGSDAGVAQERINALYQKYDQNILDGVANQLYSYQDKGLQMLRDAGFITEESYNTIKGANQNYVPFQRVMDELDDFIGLPTSKLSQPGAPIKKIKGSDRQIYSPLESIIGNTYKVEAAISKNNVAKSIVNLANIDNRLQGLFQITDKAENAIPVWENGVKKLYSAPEDIVRVVKGLNEESLQGVLKILQAPAQLLRQGATGRNIDFMIPNVFKDQFDAAVNAKYGYTPFVDYIKGLSHLMRFERTGSDELVESWINSGGKIFFEDMGGKKSLRKYVTDVGGKKPLQKLVDWAFGGLDTLGKYSETPTRIGAFKRALKATSDPLVAGYESREATLDFARMGAKMRVLNSIIPFLNVGVQGFDKLIRTAKSNPAAFSARMGIYAITPAVATTLYNLTKFPDSYGNVPQYVKDDNFVIITGEDEEGKPSYITFPKGNVLPLIANPVENFLSYVAGADRKSFTQLALQILGDTLPIIESGDNLNQSISRTLGANIPQAVKPAIENSLNASFYKNEPIVPAYLQSKLPEEQTKASTPELYNYLGNVLGMSPLQIQNIMEGYTAGFSKLPANLIDLASGKEGKGINQVPVVRRFMGEGYTTEQTEKYKSYDEKDKEKEAAMLENRKPFLERLFPTKEVDAAETKPIGSAKTFKTKDAATYYVKSKGQEAQVGNTLYYPSGDSYKTIENADKYILYKNPDGDYEKIEKKVDLKVPSLTGSNDFDVNNFSNLSSKITTRMNDIEKLYADGQLTQAQAVKQYEKLDAAQKLIKEVIKGIKAKGKVKSGKLTKTVISKLTKKQKKVKVALPKSVERITLKPKRIKISVPR